MSQPIHVDQAVLADAAAHHREASDYLSAVPSSHAAIEASLQSLGPIYGDFRQAAGALLEARKNCYDDQAAQHAAMADNLDQAAQTWNAHEESSAADYRGLVDGPQ